ncbi:unnamed protein product [Paramecium sonneborni]|uniref:Uncharacterized protein n=1 Tax=Paramecium sonneborni TaxID=65129 RepID=A0A8S1K7A9_9CILI|nr:unnamed protein product [Paramecium sonneborni]
MSWKIKESIPRVKLTHLTKTNIIDVWSHNFMAEITEIASLIEEFNVISLDTEFPGTEYDQPENDDKDYEYQQLVRNVQKYKLIQLGISISNEAGEVPLVKNTWQFHFKFNAQHDQLMNPVKIMLEQAGIRFDDLASKGIDYVEFCEVVTGSGIILNDEIKYVVFHGEFDFGYLLHLFHHSGIPDTQEEFYKMMKLYFPSIYDLKYILKDNQKYKDAGLSRLATKVEVTRIGPEHQAGSDALLTLQCYYQLKFCFPDLQSDFDKNMNIIYGIGKGYVPNNRRKTYASTSQTPDPNLQVNTMDQQYYYNQNFQYDELQTSYYQYGQQYVNFNYFQYQMHEPDQSKRKGY